MEDELKDKWVQFWRGLCDAHGRKQEIFARQLGVKNPPLIAG